MNPSNKTGKLSHLIRAGAIVHTVGGGVYRCTSKIASGVEVYIRLADLQGKPVPTPADFRPISPALARFAAWMRLAYNKDFDLYVKEYIKAAGLPIDTTMNWSKFFAARIAPKLMSKDDEVRDEAIHHIIIKTLVERNALNNFSQAIKKFPARIQELPLDKQVTAFLMQTFNWRIREANDYIRNFIFQVGTDEVDEEGNALHAKDWATSIDQEGGEDDDPINILDAQNTRRPADYDTVDNDADVAHFRNGFERYLTRVLRNKTDGKININKIVQYLAVFDVVYAHLRTGEIPRGVDLYEGWKQEAGVDKSYQWFKVLFANLPKVLDMYITKDLKDAEVSPFIEVMRSMGTGAKEPAELQPVMGGLKLADEFPINHDIESDAPSSGSSGNSDNDSGSGGGSMPELGDAAGDASEAAGGLGGELAELAPLALAAAAKNAAQWETPTCKACGKGSTQDCPACHEKFCGDCILNHHANNPSHDRVTASAKKGLGLSAAIDKAFNEDKNPRKNTAALGEEPNPVDNDPLYVDAAPEQHVGLTPPEFQKFIEECMNSGLYNRVEDEPYFSWHGCDYCNSGGATINDYTGFRNLTDAQAPNRDELEYEFRLCEPCAYKLEYGEE